MEKTSRLIKPLCRHARRGKTCARQLACRININHQRKTSDGSKRRIHDGHFRVWSMRVDATKFSKYNQQMLRWAKCLNEKRLIEFDLWIFSLDLVREPPKPRMYLNHTSVVIHVNAFKSNRMIAENLNTRKESWVVQLVSNRRLNSNLAARIKSVQRVRGYFGCNAQPVEERFNKARRRRTSRCKRGKGEEERRRANTSASACRGFERIASASRSKKGKYLGVRRVPVKKRLRNESGCRSTTRNDSIISRLSENSARPISRCRKFLSQLERKRERKTANEGNNWKLSIRVCARNYRGTRGIQRNSNVLWLQ